MVNDTCLNSKHNKRTTHQSNIRPANHDNISKRPGHVVASVYQFCEL